ncbi:hypothetical protein [Bosea sp. FBZP-16]|uniref:hypothetical protein n=1 Tax=Bosea sp. FBZP-16 TaxID=2065382 RepID=UPI00131A445E|nr:hypothetical protein [Bosea sp. FBZP-16]
MEEAQAQAIRRSAQWDAFNRVLAWVNEQENRELPKADFYHAVMDMRPVLSGSEPISLKHAGARWWHTDDYASPNLTKASLGEFFAAVLSVGAYVGEIWPFNHRYSRSAVYVSVFATDEQKAAIEGATRYRFRRPPKLKLN